MPRKTIECTRCLKTRLHHAKGYCAPCYNALFRAGRIQCSHCKKTRSHYARGLCNACARKLTPVNARNYRPPTGSFHVGSALVPSHRMSRYGYELATLHDSKAEARDRLRRVEIYARQVEEHGEILWGSLPPAPLEAATSADLENDLEEELD